MASGPQTLSPASLLSCAPDVETQSLLGVLAHGLMYRTLSRVCSKQTYCVDILHFFFFPSWKRELGFKPGCSSFTSGGSRQQTEAPGTVALWESYVRAHGLWLTHGFMGCGLLLQTRPEYDTRAGERMYESGDE